MATEEFKVGDKVQLLDKMSGLLTEGVVIQVDELGDHSTILQIKPRNGKLVWVTKHYVSKLIEGVQFYVEAIQGRIMHQHSELKRCAPRKCKSKYEYNVHWRHWTSANDSFELHSKCS